MTPSHFVARGDLAALRHRNTHHLIHARGKIAVFLAGEDFDVHNDTAFAVRHTQGGILDIARFFAKDGAQKALFGGQFFFAFGSDFSDQDVVRPDLRADSNDAGFVQIADGVVTHVGDFARDLFGSELGIAGFHFVLFDVNAGVAVFFNETLRNQDGVFEVKAFPWKQSDDHVLTKRQFSILRGGRIHDHIALADQLTLQNRGSLIDTGRLVGTLILAQFIKLQVAGCLLDHQAVAGDRQDFAVFFGNDYLSGIRHSGFFHAGRDDRNFRSEQRHRLSLHV